MDLFAYSSPAQGRTDTSREAAKKVAHGREGIWTEIKNALWQFGPLTGSEIATKLSKDILYIRPRLVELESSSDIQKTEQRRKNAKGNSEIVWCAQ